MPRTDAVLVGSTPAAQARLDAPPASVQLEFDTPLLTPAQVVVLGPAGERVETGDAAVLGARVQQGVEIDSAGRYTVLYRVTAADRHSQEGELSFVVAAPEAEAASVVPYVVLGILLAGVAVLAAVRLRRR